MHHSIWDPNLTPGAALLVKEPSIDWDVCRRWEDKMSCAGYYMWMPLQYLTFQTLYTTGMNEHIRVQASVWIKICTNLIVSHLAEV